LAAKSLFEMRAEQHGCGVPVQGSAEHDRKRRKLTSSFGVVVAH